MTTTPNTETITLLPRPTTWKLIDLRADASSTTIDNTPGVTAALNTFFTPARLERITLTKHPRRPHTFWIDLDNDTETSFMLIGTFAS